MGATCSKDDGMALDGAGAQDDPYQQQLLLQQQRQLKHSGVFGCCMASSSCSGIDPALDPRSMDSCRSDAIDPVMYDLCKKSLKMSLQGEWNDMQAAKQKEEAAPSTSSKHASSSGSRNHGSNTSQKQTSSSSAAGSSSHSAQRHNNSSNLQSQKHVGQYHLLYKHQPRSASQQNMDVGTGTSVENHANKTNTSSGGGDEVSTVPSTSPYSTRLIVRRRPIAAAEEGTHGTHLYAIRYPPDDVFESRKVVAGSTSESSRPQEQCPTPNSAHGTTAASNSSAPQREKKKRSSASNNNNSAANAGFGLDPAAEPVPEPRKPSPAAALPPQLPTEHLTDFFQPAKMKQPKASKQTIQEWVTVSEEHCIYVVDVGLTPLQCDKIVQVTEQVCRGQYAAYTYAKQTLGCREFPVLAQACAPPVQAVVQAILGLPSSNNNYKSRNNITGAGTAGKDGSPPHHLQLDDREPHLVKYDVTKKERQKLDMHTDKSEWTFLIALSNGCGLDYDGGGTFFECLNATIHVQRGHALIFPGKLRHCGQRITRGLRYLLVGFLVDKTHMATTASNSNAAAITSAAAAAAAAAKDKVDDTNKTSTASVGTNPVSAKSLTTGAPAIIGQTIST